MVQIIYYTPMYSTQYCVKQDDKNIQEISMNTFIPADACKGFQQARRKALKSVNRLCVHTNNNVFRITKAWADRFSVPAKRVKNLRGLVDIYDGPKHLF